MNKQELIEKYEKLEGVCKDPGAEIARLIFLEDLRELDEPQKVTVPQFVADWIEYCEKNNFTLFGCLDPVDDFGAPLAEEFEGDVRKCVRWCRKESNNFARAWIDGYTVEKEKRYIVTVKNIGDGWEYLKWNSVQRYWYFGNKNRLDDVRLYHTLENLQKGGFGNVFVNPLFTIEEVTE